MSHPPSVHCVTLPADVQWCKRALTGTHMHGEPFSRLHLELRKSAESKLSLVTSGIGAESGLGTSTALEALRQQVNMLTRVIYLMPTLLRSCYTLCDILVEGLENILFVYANGLRTSICR